MSSLNRPKVQLFNYHLQDCLKNPTQQLTKTTTSKQSAIELFKRDDLVKNGTIKLIESNIIEVKYA